MCAVGKETGDVVVGINVCDILLSYNVTELAEEEVAKHELGVMSSLSRMRCSSVVPWWSVWSVTGCVCNMS